MSQDLNLFTERKASLMNLLLYFPFTLLKFVLWLSPPQAGDQIQGFAHSSTLPQSYNTDPFMTFLRVVMVVKTQLKNLVLLSVKLSKKNGCRASGDSMGE